jgi:prepilin-type N-terminal cleavage/methylation domain-containing protein
MKPPQSKSEREAFTLIELLIVIGILVILAFLFLPSTSSTRTRAPRTECENNLKEVGVAFRTWAIDGGDGFPMYDPTNSGGTEELIVSGQVFVHFRPMSNELRTPKILVCPQRRWKGSRRQLQLGI